ncbi:uncharacterized protein LACBIDRAFT_298919 [Laccaria bicolor S238N-H82]|uniref:Predicted protein n=1 Tax=Laccaria bicolor (strain S238N-H82 / ATCC MYA-4686) TaxID=486041 RepID=B0DDL2_LACBS|nr:uncharacterized protein LACBIDRAFT_298919 [Laccaria bicolor S238N-H82]EDR07107.1 predicted protein [Laccaria bicolor S238N-H82]|eukprot:XP_001882038.1 predicted protein [Laccaria bicolor S238N-H82]
MYSFSILGIILPVSASWNSANINHHVIFFVISLLQLFLEEQTQSITKMTLSDLFFGGKKTL